MPRILHHLPSSLSFGFAVLLVLAARPAAAVETGTLVIEARDSSGGLIPGGCYVVDWLGPFCDEEGDGQIQLTDVPSGEWQVYEEWPPSGYQNSGPSTHLVQVEPGATATIVFTYAALVGDGTIVVEAVDRFGNLLGGGCFGAGGPNIYLGPFCDNEAEDADPTPGRVTFTDLVAGNWGVAEWEAPAGYQIAASQQAFVDLGATVRFVFEHDPIEEDFEPVARPTAELFEPVPVTPPPQIFLAPSFAGVAATIVAATSAGGVPTKVVGTSGNDVIVGTAGPDLINGLGGHDLICSLDGADTIQGGDGDDWIAAGPGDDALAGGVGRDHLDGGAGKRDACDGGTTAGGIENDTAVNCESTVAIP